MALFSGLQNIGQKFISGVQDFLSPTAQQVQSILSRLTGSLQDAFQPKEPEKIFGEQGMGPLPPNIQSVITQQQQLRKELDPPKLTGTGPPKFSTYPGATYTDVQTGNTFLFSPSGWQQTSTGASRIFTPAGQTPTSQPPSIVNQGASIGSAGQTNPGAAIAAAQAAAAPGLQRAAVQRKFQAETERSSRESQIADLQKQLAAAQQKKSVIDQAQTAGYVGNTFEGAESFLSGQEEDEEKPTEIEDTGENIDDITSQINALNDSIQNQINSLTGIAGPSREQLETEKQVENILTSRDLGIAEARESPIATPFIRGQAAALERRAELQTRPLLQQIADFQRRRELERDIARIKLEGLKTQRGALVEAKTASERKEEQRRKEKLEAQERAKEEKELTFSVQDVGGRTIRFGFDRQGNVASRQDLGAATTKTTEKKDETITATPTEKKEIAALSAIEPQFARVPFEIQNAIIRNLTSAKRAEFIRAWKNEMQKRKQSIDILTFAEEWERGQETEDELTPPF